MIIKCLLTPHFGEPIIKVKQNLIFLPGQLCDLALWQFQMPALDDVAEMTVADLTLDDTVQAMAVRLLQSAPPRFALCGLSLGGYVAFEIMRRAPARVTHLAIMNSSARADETEQAARRGRNIKATEIGAFKGVTHRLLPGILHPDHVADPALAALVMAMTERVGRVAFVQQQTAIMQRPDSRAGLTDIDCPVLVVGGGADRVTPFALQQEIAAGIKGARLELLDICGHLAPIEQPDIVNRLLRHWLMATGR